MAIAEERGVCLVGGFYVQANSVFITVCQQNKGKKSFRKSSGRNLPPSKSFSDWQRSLSEQVRDSGSRGELPFIYSFGVISVKMLAVAKHEREVARITLLLDEVDQSCV